MLAASMNPRRALELMHTQGNLYKSHSPRPPSIEFPFAYATLYVNVVSQSYSLDSAIGLPILKFIT